MDGCGRPHHGHGYCRLHLFRLRGNGTLHSTVKPPVEKPCTCPRVFHEHGTSGRYTKDGCRCTACRDGMARQKAYIARMKAYGRWEPWGTAVGVCRRIQGLMFLGHQEVRLAERLGIDKTNIHDYANSRVQRVTRDRFEKIDALFEELLAAPPPEGWRAEQTRRRARERGFVSPLAWDDIDNPNEKPKGAAA